MYKSGLQNQSLGDIIIIDWICDDTNTYMEVIMSEKVRITLFKGFGIFMDNKPVLDSLSNTRKTKLFLCYLLLNKEKPISHKELFELLWSGEDYANPGTALRTLLYRYRALVENAEIDALDNLITDEKVNFIKMDIEGSEMEALKGATKIIEISKPILAICVYHKSEDLFTIPQYIKKLNPNYKFYLRKHSNVSSHELVLYAIDQY